METLTGYQSEKIPFYYDRGFKAIRKAIAPFAKAAMFELRDLGYKTVFEQLVSCILSIRTRDEVSLPLSQELFSVARSPEEILSLSVDQLDKLISKSTFHYGKANQIREIARVALEKYNGNIPCDEEVLRSFSGVGPKCANLVLGVACNIPKISVDVHVHRVTNRWGILYEKTPERTLKRLEQILPEKHWIEINELLVPFGKHVCTFLRPKCSTCPVLKMCQQVGVKNPR